MLRRTATVLAVVAASQLLLACGADSSADRGDCNARIRYEGTVYRPHNELNPDAPRGGKLGSAEVVDCGDATSAPVVDEAVIFSVRGVATSVAVMVSAREWRGIYVAENVADGVPPSDWPRPLRSKSR